MYAVPCGGQTCNSWEGHVDTARIVSLERSFDMAGYDIIGILESRFQGEVMSSGTIYDMYALELICMVAVGRNYGCGGLCERRLVRSRPIRLDCSLA